MLNTLRSKLKIVHDSVGWRTDRWCNLRVLRLRKYFETIPSARGYLHHTQILSSEGFRLGTSSALHLKIIANIEIHAKDIKVKAFAYITSLKIVFH